MKLIRHNFKTFFRISEHLENKMNKDDYQQIYNGFGAIIKDNQNRILIQKHIKYNIYTIPIGKCSISTQTDTGIRVELLEECGITARTLLQLDKGDLIFETFDGREIHIIASLIEVLSYTGQIKNMEPDKHEYQRFMEIGEIKKFERLSYMTQLYLKNFV